MTPVDLNARVRNIGRDPGAWRPRAIVRLKGRDLGRQHDFHVLSYRNMAVLLDGWSPRMKAALLDTAYMHGVIVKAILSPARHQEVNLARQELMARLRASFGLSIGKIGAILKRDRKTVIHGIRRHLEHASKGGHP
ncbi:helix-turn-helix domain-containing protein [Lichenifustis flavocetrariae]|uniref:Chromosomal replication initiator DnaA C-terminal domain-containing protein n=1 Tax=Lichenifustis flavocetrariae TaxID=2949735 RepID=A0AA41Z3T6_9HYPH|nr:helix-turn-helix domain-containing protein [Lichenifustis flavocetrariae]MCW6513194.1 hypothetical protein [Lichenifustis flavocetrariae]